MVDPVGTGLVASLRQPGGNVTEATDFLPDLAANTYRLLKQALPGATRLAIVFNAANPAQAAAARDAIATTTALGFHVQPLEVRSVDDLAGAFEAAARERAEVVHVRSEGPLSWVVPILR